MKLLDLFAGIGGFSLAAHWLEWQTAAFVEWDKYRQRVLKKNFPNIPIHGDIREFDGMIYQGAVDIISGGFPCQPFSAAGKRKGADDNRYLWPQMLRVIQEVRPAFVVGENVAGLLSMDSGKVFEQICTSLEDEAYEVESFVIPACAKGAPHRRDRVWIIAHSLDSYAGLSTRTLQEENQGEGVQQEQRMGEPGSASEAHAFTTHSNSKQNNSSHQERLYPESGSEDPESTADANQQGLQGSICGEFGSIQETNRAYQRGESGRTVPASEQWKEHWFEVATLLCRMDDGLPETLDSAERKTIYNAVGHFGREEVEQKIGVDCSKVEEYVQRTSRLKALGNAIVPQVACEIFKAIKTASNSV